MDPDGDLNPDKDDLPLRANTNHILVRHYELDLSVAFDRRVINGRITLFLEPCSAVGTGTKDDTGPGADEAVLCKGKTIQSSPLWKTTSDDDFTLVLDCCDLDVSKVEEVDAASVSSVTCLASEVTSETSGVVQKFLSMPSSRWRQKHQLFSACGRAPGVQSGSPLHFCRDRWSLQIRKIGVASPQDFPRALRICYETKPMGGSVRWTKDQDNRFDSGRKEVQAFYKTVVIVLDPLKKNLDLAAGNTSALIYAIVFCVRI